MYVEEFPLCCGAYVVCDFGYTNCTEARRVDLPKTRIESDLKDIVKNYRGKCAFLFAILNQTQVKEVGDIILGCGFVSVCKGKHPGHNSELTTYVYSYNPL